MCLYPKLTEAQTAGQDIANAKDNATLEASINKAYTEMELAINMLTESDIRTGAMVENKEAFMENYKQQLAAQAILNKLNQSQTNVNNQQIKNLQEGINLIKSQTNLNEQQIQNLLQQIVNMKTENINNTIKTNQGNRQLELKSREIDGIEKLGREGINYIGTTDNHSVMLISAGTTLQVLDSLGYTKFTRGVLLDSFSTGLNDVNSYRLDFRGGNSGTQTLSIGVDGYFDNPALGGAVYLSSGNHYFGADATTGTLLTNAPFYRFIGTAPKTSFNNTGGNIS